MNKYEKKFFWTDLISVATIFIFVFSIMIYYTSWLSLIISLSLISYYVLRIRPSLWNRLEEEETREMIEKA